MRNIFEICPIRRRPEFSTGIHYPVQPRLVVRARVFPFDTCWLMESIRLSPFISSPKIGDSLLSPAGRFRRREEHQIRPDSSAFHFRDQDASPRHADATWAGLSSPARENKKRRAACFLVTRWPGNTGGSPKQTECRCSWCGKRGCGQKRSEQMKGWREGRG